jgi:cell division protein FtsW
VFVDAVHALAEDAGQSLEEAGMSAAAVPAGPGLWQRLRALAGARPPESADVLPVRVGGTEYRRTTATPAHVLGLDQALIWVVVLLLAWGLVMVYSASIAMPDNPRFGKIAPTISCCATMPLGGLCRRAAGLPGAHEGLGARRPGCSFSIAAADRGADPACGQGGQRRAALAVAGHHELPASELAKFAVLIYAADYMVRKMEVKERFFRAVLPMAWPWRGGRAAAGRARHGRLHGDRRDRHGHSVPGRRERAHVLPHRAVLVAPSA